MGPWLLPLGGVTLVQDGLEAEAMIFNPPYRVYVLKSKNYTMFYYHMSLL